MQAQQTQAPPRAQPHRRALLLALVVLTLVVSLPFVNQALHIDDQVYLMGAQIIARAPARPHDARVDLFGDRIPWIRANQHPPGLPYYLALVTGAVGQASEPALHLAMLPWLALLLWASWMLARELGAPPGWVALALLSAPPVVLASHTLMTDVPLAALFTAALWACLAAHRLGGAGRLAAALVLCAGAWFVQYRGALVLPAAVALALPVAPAVGSRRAAWLRLGAVLASLPLLLAAWGAWNMWEMGQLHFADASSMIDYGQDRLALSVTAMLAYAGGTLAPLALLALWRLRRNRPAAAGLVLASMVAAVALPLLLPQQTPGPRVAAGALAAMGVLWIGGSALCAWTGAGQTLGGRVLALVLLGLFSVQCVVSLFACARMLLLVLPLALIALLRGGEAGSPEVDANNAPTRIPRPLLLAALAINLALSGVLSWADASHAGAYRDAAPQIARLATATGSGRFIGEWGLRNYLEAAGLRYVRRDDPSPRAGDHVVVPRLNVPHPPHPALKKRLGSPRAFPIKGRCPVRLMDPALGAGYYSEGYGVLPFSFTAWDRPYDVLKIYPVVR